MQCLEIGLFDEIESLGETCTAETIAKKCGYDVAVLERLLSTLASYNLLQKDCNRKGNLNLYDSLLISCIVSDNELDITI